MQAKRQRQGQGASVTALAAVTHAEAVILFVFLDVLTCTDCNMIFYTLFLTEVLSLPWQLLHMHSIGSAQLFLLFVNEYLEDVICEFFDILKYLHVHISCRDCIMIYYTLFCHCPGGYYSCMQCISCTIGIPGVLPNV